MIEIKLTFETMEQAAPYFAALSGVKGIDTPARGVKSSAAAPKSTVEVADREGGAPAGALARPPRRTTAGKTEAADGVAVPGIGDGGEAGVETRLDGAEGERVSEDVGAATPSSEPTPTVDEVVNMLMDKFHGGDSEMKAKIKTWRDSMGIGRMVDMKPEQAGDAYQFYLSL